MTKWEYVTAEGLSEANEFGKHGWEAYQVCNDREGTGYYMKRQTPVIADDTPEPPTEPDIVEQIKAGEIRLRKLYPCLRLAFRIDDKMSSDEKEFVSLEEHLEKLMKLLTGADSVDLHIDNTMIWYIVNKHGGGI